jgi:hypothetical protein
MRCALLFAAPVVCILVDFARAADTPVPSQVRAASDARAKYASAAELPELAATPAGKERVYRIECAVFQREPDGKDAILSRPVVATVAHRPAHVQIAQATPLVTGIERTADGKAKPHVTVVTSGITWTIKLAPDEAGRVAFDVAIERTAIESVDVKKETNGALRHSARIASETTRIIDRVDLGKKLTIGLDDQDAGKSNRRVEFTVTEMKADESVK